ncbi:MAG: TIGR01777 family protein [Caldilineales bacterium]|nr:TIGR01777 family protein [Caldilineales bacterium]
MRVIITGGSGLLGKPLAAELAQSGYEVIVLSRDPARAANSLPPGVRAHKWDARTAADWGHLADGAHAIINFAGESIAGSGRIPARWSEKRKRAIYESRIYAGLAVVEAIEAAAVKPQMLLQASAVGYYGQRQDDDILTEASPAGADFLGQTCQAWEDATAPVEQMGVRRAIARTGLVLTTAGGPLPITIFQTKLFAGGPIGGGRQWWPWIHLRDEIDALKFLLQNEKASGPFNLTAPNPVPQKAFARTLGRVMNRPSLLPAPEIALRLALGEIATLVLDGQRALPQRLLDLGFTFRHPDLFYALRDIVRR